MAYSCMVIQYPQFFSYTRVYADDQVARIEHEILTHLHEFSIKHKNDIRNLELKVKDNFATNAARFEHNERMVSDKVEILTAQDRELHGAIVAANLRMDNSDVLNENRDENKTAAIRSLSDRLDDVKTELSTEIIVLKDDTNKSFKDVNDKLKRNDENKTEMIDLLSQRVDGMESDLTEELVQLRLGTNGSFEDFEQLINDHHANKTALITSLSEKLEDVASAGYNNISRLEQQTNVSFQEFGGQLRRYDEEKTDDIAALSVRVTRIMTNFSRQVVQLKQETDVSMESHQTINNQSFNDIHRLISDATASLNSLEPKLKSDVAQLLGASYIRWGRRTCPTNTEILYSGEMHF